MALAKQYDQNFELFFWGVYPKKVGKAQAEKEFLKLALTEDQMRELREHIELRKRKDVKWLPNKNGQTFIVDPERFLKHRRFEDDYEVARNVRVPAKFVHEEEREAERTAEQLERDRRAAARGLAELKGLLH